MSCRPGCGACCIAPSISSAIPGMPGGKEAGVACLQLDGELRCQIFGRPERPLVCQKLKPQRLMCGFSAGDAMSYLEDLERQTDPKRL